MFLSEMFSKLLVGKPSTDVTGENPMGVATGPVTERALVVLVVGAMTFPTRESDDDVGSRFGAMVIKLAVLSVRARLFTAAMESSFAGSVPSKGK